jgi:DNA-binding HxlR family transcriptional regulator
MHRHRGWKDGTVAMEAVSSAKPQPRFEEQTHFQKYHDTAELKFVKFRFRDCPVKTTLGVLGKKWTLPILGEMGLYGKDRFNRLLETISGIAPKVLAQRLTELERAGLITRLESGTSRVSVRWALTEKGNDAMAIVLMFIAYGSKYEAGAVFDDKRPRRLFEILDDEGMKLVRSFL